MSDQEKNKWYILNVVAGQEPKVVSEINSMILKGLISVKEILVPQKETVRVKNGRKTKDIQRLFPGYVFIKIELDNIAQNTINSIPKVIGFLGKKNSPDPVSDAKMNEIIKSSSEQNKESKPFVFEVGEVISIVDGPFESFSGVVEEFDLEKSKLKISVMIFGRSTLVELDPCQVEKRKSPV